MIEFIRPSRAGFFSPALSAQKGAPELSGAQSSEVVRNVGDPAIEAGASRHGDAWHATAK